MWFDDVAVPLTPRVVITRSRLVPSTISWYLPLSSLTTARLRRITTRAVVAPVTPDGLDALDNDGRQHSLQRLQRVVHAALNLALPSHA